MSHMKKPEPGKVVAACERRSKRRDPVFPPAAVEHRLPILPEPDVFDAGRWQRVLMLAGRTIETMRAAERAEQARQALERARRVGAPEQWASNADRGAQGLAMAARGAKVEDVLVDVQEQAGETYLERASVARVRDGVIDHYERIGVLWGRRLDAVAQLSDLYQRSRIAPGTARSGGGQGYGNMSAAQAMAWKDWCRAGDHLRPGERPVVEDVARGFFPAALGAAAKLRSGAWDLANHFLLSPDKIVDRPEPGS